MFVCYFSADQEDLHHPRSISRRQGQPEAPGVGRETVPHMNPHKFKKKSAGGEDDSESDDDDDDIDGKICPCIALFKHFHTFFALTRPHTEFKGSMTHLQVLQISIKLLLQIFFKKKFKNI